MKGLERVLNAYYNSEKMSLENLCNSPTVIEKQVHLTLKGTLIGIGKYEWLENDNSTVAKQRWSQGGMAYNFLTRLTTPMKSIGWDSLLYFGLFVLTIKNCIKYYLRTSEATWIIKKEDTCLPKWYMTYP